MRCSKEELGFPSWSEVRSLERAPQWEIQSCKQLIDYRNRGKIGKKKISPPPGAGGGKSRVELGRLGQCRPEFPILLYALCSVPHALGASPKMALIAPKKSHYRPGTTLILDVIFGNFNYLTWSDLVWVPPRESLLG